MLAPRAEIERRLREQFGHRTFRPGQWDALRSLLEGRDVLSVLPTGAGKSLVYQLAAQVLQGVTLVVSPLLALMKDQVESMEDLGLHVAEISSAQRDADIQQSLERARSGNGTLLYVTPERFDDPDFVAAAKQLPVRLFVVDEAHSVSEWGHTFRPAYLGLREAIRVVGRPTILAMTATATPWVRHDIVELLGMRDPDVLVRGVDRPNLRFEVRRIDERSRERRVLQGLLDPTRDEDDAEEVDPAFLGSGIVYTATTRAAQETAEWLQSWGIAADYYHGQRRKADRARVQDAFMAGAVRVIAATNAFGMGVDKPDVRFVIHRDIPANLEAYYQEAGRAGRDGQPARCVLIYRPAALGTAAFLSGTGQADIDDVQLVRAALMGAGRSLSLKEMAEGTGIGRGTVAHVVAALKEAGLVRETRGKVRLAVDDFAPEDVPLDREERRRAYERSRLEMMRGYAETLDCRRRYILNYFGDDLEGDACGNCDSDLRRTQQPAGEATIAADSPFQVQQAVRHPSWGPGVVQRVASDAVTVLFEQVGYKVLSLQIVQEQGLLQAA